MVAGRKLLVVSIGVLVGLAARTARAAPRNVPLSLGDKWGSLSVSLRGAVVRRTTGRRELVGWVELTLPLERFVAAPRVLLPRAAVPFAQTRGFVRKGGPAQLLAAAIAEGGTSEQPRARAPRFRLTPRLARATVHVALRANGFPAVRRRIASLASRAKSSALLPEMRLRAARTRDDSLRFAPTSSDPYRYTQAGGTSLWLEARLTWRLGRLVFADDELGAERLRLKWADARSRLVEQVLAALFSWQKALLKADDDALLPEERASAALDALEAEATLDVLTGGWFSQHAL